MVVKAVDSLVEPFRILGKEGGYYVLRGLAGFGIILATLTLLGIISGVTLVGALTSMGVTDIYAEAYTFEEINTIFLDLAGVGLFILLLVIIAFLLIYSVALGIIRDYAKSLIEGKKEYKLFVNLGVTLTYLLAIFALPLPLILISFLISLMGTISILLIIPLSIAYGIFMLQFVILPAVVAYRNENGFKAIATTWSILANQRWNVIGATLLFILAMVLLAGLTIVLSLIPFLGELLLLALNFMVMVYTYLWIINVYKQAID